MLQHCREELRGALMLRAGEDLIRWAVFDDLVPCTNDSVTSTPASGLLSAIQLSQMPASAKTSALPEVTIFIPS